MVSTTEISPNVYRISIFFSEINLEFSHFLVRDDEPLLFHAGLRGMFPLLREQVSRLIDVSKLRHVGFSHFESDECGALNQWLELAPAAQPVCGLVGALVSVNDFALRPARAMVPDDRLSTGQYSFRFIPTPHVPHGWDAGRPAGRNGTHSVLLRPVSPMGTSRAGNRRQHHGSLPRRFAGSRGRSVRKLCSLHSPHWPRPRVAGRTQAENSGDDAWFNLLWRRRTGAPRSRDSNAGGAWT